MAPKKTTALTNFDEQLSALAKKGQDLAKQRGGNPGSFIGTGSGRWKIDGVTQTSPDLDIVIADAILENSLYTGTYDPSTPAPPVCFALGREDGEMVPHEKSTNPQGTGDYRAGEGYANGANCAECWANVYGSADKGKGKACKNLVRLGVIPAAGLVQGSVAKTPVKFVKVPVTSGKAWAKYSGELADVEGLPAVAVITTATLSPRTGGGHEMTFTMKERIGAAFIPELIALNESVAKVIDFPYEPSVAEPAQQATTARGAVKAPAKPAARGAQQPVTAASFAQKAPVRAPAKAAAPQRTAKY